ncbi:zinc ABC transporter substrate-binding protein [Planktomarina temperata]|nr:zinc ABC transporter substrate-binding protein [Planktomarina temperata]
MSRTLLSLCLTAAWLAGPAYADRPRVVVDIAPIQALVAQVMEGIGMPDLIIQPGATPHEYSLRPSEAAALQSADLVFWIGPDLTPWLEEAIETLAPAADLTTLMDVDGTVQLEFREDAVFEAHDHSDHADDDEHDDHADHGDHAGHDPHAWLSPKNAMTWLEVIAGRLSAVDPVNSDAYLANAASGRVAIEALMDEVDATLDPVRGRAFIVFHDAYQYFETDFDISASGAISISDASDPSPARIAEIRGQIAEQGVDCVLAEPQFNPGLVATVLRGSDAQMGIVDPLGADLELGAELYPQLIRNLSNALAECLHSK